METEELEALDPLHYSPVDENGGVFGPLFPVVHDQLLGLADVEEEVAVLVPHYQVSDLLAIGCVIRPTAVMSSANLMMVVEACLPVQSWVKREYRGGLSTHP